jgi:alcohol dehydrogenase
MSNEKEALYRLGLKQSIQVGTHILEKGGSAMDAGKVLNVSLAPECSGYSLSTLLTRPELHTNAQPGPLYTVPTTSGTGSEVTPFATVWNHEIKKKLSLAGPAVWAKMAFVDADLTDSVPVYTTISTGLDAINQAAESIWNKNANSITLGYAIRALQLGFMALPKLARGVGEKVDRDQMAEASVLAGLAISHTRTALCHSMSYPITAHFGVPHGLACAFTMPKVLKHNLPADDGRFRLLSEALVGSSDVLKLVECFEKLNFDLKVSEKVKQKVDSLDDLLKLEPEMHTPERAGNNLRPIRSVASILEASWRDRFVSQ